MQTSLSANPAESGKSRIAWKKAASFFLLGVAFLPIVFLSGVPYPSISGKTLFLRGLITLVLLCMALFAWIDQSYRAGIARKARQLWKSPLAKAVALSYVLLIASTVGAFDRYIAFFSNAERAEGFVGLSFFYGFFFLTSILFEKKEWDRFFFLALISGWIVVVLEIGQALAGVVRPASLLDNPIYLAGYLLFVVFAGCTVWNRGKEEKRGKLAFYGALSVCLAIVGIFVTESRGVMAGLVIGAVAVLAYLAVVGKGKNVFGRFDVKKMALSFLIALGLLALMFLGTRHEPFWNNVPGFNRIADYSLKDDTTLSRGISSKIAIEAVNPNAVGPERMLLGWGWDNYVYAWQKFYDPRIYVYDPSLFDRPHDKLLDMLSMTGVLGLLAYLLIWVYFFRSIFRVGRRALFEGAALLLFAVAFFIQDLTAFDTVVTFVVFFTILAYCLYRERQLAPVEEQNSATASVATTVVLSVLGLAAAWAFVASTLVPHIQMAAYRSELQKTWPMGTAMPFSESVFSPDTYAQGTIRADLLNTVLTAYSQGQITKPNPFLDTGIAEMEDYLKVHPYLYNNELVLAKAYDMQADLHGNDPSDLDLAGAHYRAALALIPDRQTVIYPYALNLEKQGRTAEAAALLNEIHS